MAANPLVDFVERLRAHKPEYDWQPVVVEPEAPAYARRLTACEPPGWTPPTGDVQAARALIRSAIWEYLDDPFPTEVLLVRAMPGLGKTTAAVAVVEELASRGKRVLYSGPRHDFFQVILEKSGDPRLWYEWLPRQAGDAETGKPQTCLWAEQITTWLNRGHDAMSFCSGVCGWDYVKNACIYHGQKRATAPIIFGQHQHVALGHPLDFHIFVGDENPLAVFTHEWRIPAQWVMPPGMAADEPLTEILYHLQLAATNAVGPIDGPALLDFLGGAAAVIQACETFEMPIGELDKYESIHRPEEATRAPYFHLFSLVPLLLREAKQAQAGACYPHRIIVSQGQLTLLLRRKPKELPDHVVWLDATGRERLYQAAFGRPVRVINAEAHLYGKVYQVIDRANGKRATEDASKGPQLRLLCNAIARRYQAPTVIGFKKFVEDDQLEGRKSHFYAARGENAHENADAVIIAGAPQADIYGIVKLAKMLFFERDAAFRVEWVTRERPYRYVAPNGQGRMYPVGGFWNDPDLQAVLETLREDEILQAAHRGRPVNHALDIWLLTNVPLDALPPDELMTIRDVLGSPAGVNVFKWQQVQEFIQTVDAVTISDLVVLGLHYDTARDYLTRISQLPGWEMAAVKSGKPGLPAKTAKRILAVSINNISLLCKPRVFGGESK